MAFVDTNALEVWERRPGWRGRFYRSEAMSFSRYDFSAGSWIHEHHHPSEEVWYVIDGELEVTVGAETRAVGPGGVVIVAPDQRHSVRATSDGRALIASHPPRADEPR